MLNYQQLKALRPEDKMYAVTVFSGVQLRVFPSGTKTWHINKSINGKRIVKDLGQFPDVGITEVKEYVENLKNPVGSSDNFRELYNDWLNLKKKQIKNWVDIDKRFTKYILPVFGNRSFHSINPPELINLLKKDLEIAGKYETIKRICIWFKQLEVYGVNSGRITSLRFQGINQIFPAPKVTHLKSIHPSELTSVFFQIIFNSTKANQTWLTIQVAFYTLLRPSEYCNLKWEWVDFANKTITIPAEYMKMHTEHTIPITTQLLNLLVQINKINPYILASPDKYRSPITITAIPRFFKRHGITRLQPHGIRSIGRTWMAENDIDDDIAELCLAHKIGSKVTRAYKRTTLLEERRIAMQKWSDFVESCILEAKQNIAQLSD